MLANIARKVFGNANERLLRPYYRKVERVNAFEQNLQKLSDTELTEKTQEFRNRLQVDEKLDALLPEAFAVVREASKRVMGMRHFDVQMIGGMVLHEGRIAEMKTGEGKTLVATLAVYLNALEGKGVHVVTVNDYLARRDSEWMGKLYRFLGLTVGVITNDLEDYARKEAYACDITYATNNELGFDYLRDNMKYSRDAMVQRPFNYAVVDEVDSILIDEARTPLIISGPVEDSTDLYVRVDELIAPLEKTDYDLDEKARSVVLNEEGTQKVEDLLVQAGLLEAGGSMYDIANVLLVHHVNQALRAHKLFTIDVDYIVKDDKVIIIDEFTGRMMDGRRYSDGLHQALEAKEKVSIQNENQTLASITFQNYFRLYPKLSGMTGTALTEANEFSYIYKLEVAEIPTNIPVSRIDEHDEIYRTRTEKYEAVAAEIKAAQKTGQPVLVGTVSIEQSEELSNILKKQKIPHKVLNARYHEQEAYIVAQAGKSGSVTIATNMAGRGTDIKLGGNEDMLLDELAKQAENELHLERMKKDLSKQVAEDKEKVLAAGGLYVIGTERHESRRIDNQLRGRSGRQGDPGRSKFYISLEDDLMRIFGSERIDGMLQRLGLKAGEAIIHPWMNKALERAQGKVEARNYDMRKNVLKYDDVMNDQRKVIFEQRIELMDAENVKEEADDMRLDVCELLVTAHIPQRSYPEQWDMEGLHQEILRIFDLDLPVQAWAKEEGIADEEILERLVKATDEQMEEKEGNYGEEMMNVVRKRLLLQTLDQLWKEHLHALDHLRSGIHLRGYGQRDPLNEYKQEAFALFEAMLRHLRELVTERLAHLQIHTELVDDGEEAIEHQAKNTQIHLNPSDPASWGEIGRNEPCPCGSGEKYKHCHGKLV